MQSIKLDIRCFWLKRREKIEQWYESRHRGMSKGILSIFQLSVGQQNIPSLQLWPEPMAPNLDRMAPSKVST